MDDKKYRILYNEQRVIDVQEDNGTRILGSDIDCMVIVDTKEGAKILLESIGVDTYRIFNEIESSEIGIDYLDSLERRIDPIDY
jgi:hypothetical protein